MKACSYCGRQNPDDALSCSGCGKRIEAPRAETSKVRVGEYVSTPPPDHLAELDMEFEVIEGFSRPNWEKITQFINEHVSTDDFSAAWSFAAEKWVEQLARDLGGPSRVSQSEN